MQRHLILILLACLGLGFAPRAMAQARLLSPEMYIGASGGVSASMVVFNPSVPGTSDVLKTALLGGRGGLMFRYSGHRCCGVQVELNYSRTGWRENTDTHSYMRQLDYLEVPFLTHIWFGKPHFRGFVNLGPQVAFCLNESESGTRQTAVVQQYNALDNRVDWGIGGGVGFYGRSEKAGCFQFEARYSYSLGTLFSSKTGAYFSNSNMMILSLNIAYLWQIK